MQIPYVPAVRHQGDSTGKSQALYFARFEVVQSAATGSGLCHYLADRSAKATTRPVWVIRAFTELPAVIPKLSNRSNANLVGQLLPIGSYQAKNSTIPLARPVEAPILPPNYRNFPSPTGVDSVLHGSRATTAGVLAASRAGTFQFGRSGLFWENQVLLTAGAQAIS